MVDLNKRLVEVDEILNYLSDEEYAKIPKDIINAIKENKDKYYVWKYDESRELKDQDLNRDTIVILSYLNMEYLLSQEQKELMEEIHKANEKENDKYKAEQHGIESLFNNKEKKETNIKLEEKTVQNELIPCEEGVLKKIIRFIKNLFK